MSLHGLKNWLSERSSVLKTGTHAPSSPCRLPPQIELDRRSVIVSTVSLGLLSTSLPASASKLGATGDRLWEGMGGGPPDLFYPDSWEGTWQCQSTLVKVDLPFGEDYVSNMNAVKRAKDSDLNQTISYPVRFVRNAQGRVVSDRAFNTVALVELYMGKIQGVQNRVDWDINDPNVLQLRLPGGMNIRTRVTRRSEETPDDSGRRLETSEYFEQVFDDPSLLQPRVKASQCFTKYAWRTPEEAKGGPEIVATQTVGDFLTSFDDEKKLIATLNKPVTLYVYKMAFTRLPGESGKA